MISSNREWKLIAAVVFLIAWVAIFRLFPISSNLPTNDNDILGGFIEWFGALFGIILALVLVQVWAKHSQINEEIDREADALTLLVKTCNLLPYADAKERVAQRVKTYAEKVKNRGLKDKKNHSAAEDPQQREIVEALDSLHRSIGEIVTNPAYPHGMGGELLRLMNDVIDNRGDRLSHVHDHVPKPMWQMIMGTSTVWLTAFFALHIDNDLLAMFITGGALFTVSAILFVINDIDNHVGGFWYANFTSFNVPIEETEKVLKEIQEEPAAHRDHPPRITVIRTRKRMR